MKENVVVIEAAQQRLWEEYFNRLPIHLQDIHFKFDYHYLYELNGDGKIRLFIYEEAESFYFYPFLIRPVPGKQLLNDIETVYGYTGPLSTTNDESFLQKADKAFAAYCQSENIISEFVRFNPVVENEKFYSASSGIQKIHLRDYVSVDLKKSLYAIEAAYTSQNRNKIRKAEKAEITIEYDAAANRFGDFESIYLSNMERLHAVPMYFFSPAFFEGLKKLVIKSGILINARLNNETIGSTVFLKGGKFGHYFLSSANEEGRKLAAGNLMLHHGIKWCKQQKLESMHLGGGLTGDENDPLLVFKKNFSKQTVAFYIGKRIHNESEYSNLVNEWDAKHPEMAKTQKAILQRYRMSE